MSSRNASASAATTSTALSASFAPPSITCISGRFIGAPLPGRCQDPGGVSGPPSRREKHRTLRSRQNMRSLLCAGIFAVVALAAGPASADARTYVGCGSNDFSHVIAKVEPASCNLLALRGTGLQLKLMAWRSWGGKDAFGEGLDGSSKIRVKLYHPVRVKGGVCYTRAFYRAKYGSGRLAFAKCGARF